MKLDIFLLEINKRYAEFVQYNMKNIAFFDTYR